MFGLSDLAVKAIVAAIIAACIFGGGMKLDHDIMLGKIEKIEIAQKNAIIAAQQKQAANDQLALKAATDEAQAQQQAAVSLQKELSNAKSHITIKACVPYGFLRVLFAFQSGGTVDSVALPTGKSDDACSGVGWADVATAIGHNFGNARANAQQLNALIALLKAQGIKEKQ